MLKERDSYVGNQQLIANLPLTLIPIEFIKTNKQYNVGGEYKQLELEYFYSVERKYFEEETVYLSDETFNIFYLGIIELDGHVKLHRIRTIHHNKIDDCLFFYCKNVSRSKKRQLRLEKWEKRINELLQLENFFRQV